MFTHIYSCLPMFTHVYLCLSLFTRASLPTLTDVYSCLPMFNPVYSCFSICGISGENRPTGAKFPMEIIDL